MAGLLLDPEATPTGVVAAVCCQAVADWGIVKVAV